MTDKTVLSVPQVASRLGVHRNTVLYWLKMGFMKSRPKNALVSRPQNVISIREVERVEAMNKGGETNK